MATETEFLPLKRPRAFHFAWVLPLFWRPRRTLSEAADQNRATWITPLIVLTLLALLAVLVAAPIRQAAVANGPQSMPPDFQYWSPEQQQQYIQTLSAQSGPVFVYLFPALSSLIKIWVGWLLLGGVLHLVLTLAGSRSTLTLAFNLAGWASLPLALRSLVQVVSMLFTHQLIASPGLAGFAPAESAGLVSYLVAMLPIIDLYLLWMAALLLVGVRLQSGIGLGKVWGSVLVTLVVVLALQALPGFISGQLGSLSTGGRFFGFF